MRTESSSWTTPAIYDEPPYLAGKVLYAGYVLRSLGAAGVDKAQAGANSDSPRAQPSFWSLRGRGNAFRSAGPNLRSRPRCIRFLDARNKRLLWVAGDPDYSSLLEKSRDRHDLMILSPITISHRPSMAADLVITKGNRLPLFECETLGIPSISISYGYNPVDDYRVSHIRTNIALRARGLEKSTLRDYMVKSLSRVSEIRHMVRRDVESQRWRLPEPCYHT